MAATNADDSTNAYIISNPEIIVNNAIITLKGWVVIPSCNNPMLIRRRLAKVPIGLFNPSQVDADGAMARVVKTVSAAAKKRNKYPCGQEVSRFENDMELFCDEAKAIHTINPEMSLTIARLMGKMD